MLAPEARGPVQQNGKDQLGGRHRHLINDNIKMYLKEGGSCSSTVAWRALMNTLLMEGFIKMHLKETECEAVD
jgi:hypothetical protein